jgi:glycerol-3-phosphate dehydrogenase
MARHLDDIVLRRSELGTAGMPSDAELSAAAGIAAVELGWSDARAADELARARAAYWWRCA